MAKAPNKKEEEKIPEAEGGESPPKKKGKLPLIVGLVVLLAAGGGAWFFLAQGKGDEAAQQQAKPQAPKPPVFVPLDAFTVNLSSDSGEQYLQVAATLKVLDQPAADAVKQYMPEVRHKALALLSTKRPAEIITGEGRERLAEEIRQTANNVVLAATGRPAKPVVLDIALPVDKASAPAPESAAPEAPAPAAENAAGDAPRDGAAPAGAAAATPAPEAAPAPTAAPAKPATALAKAAADDPVQSVFFTSFIIQ